MNICHLVHSFMPLTHGGTETYVLALARAQAAQGHRVQVVSGSDKKHEILTVRREIVEDIPVFFYPWTSSGTGNGRASIPIRLAIQDLVREESLDLIHLHHWHGLGLDLVASARDLGVPAVVTLHDYFACCPRFFRLKADRTCCPPDVGPQTCHTCCAPLVPGMTVPDFRDLWQHRRWRMQTELSAAHTVLALSRSARSYLNRVPGFESFTLRVMPLPRPETVSPLTPMRKPRPEGQLRLVSWGGLVPGKGLDVVVEACESSPHAGRFSIDHHGRILDPDFHNELQARARQCALRFLGPYEAEVMAGWPGTYDLAVFPSFFMETHGFVVDEAMSLGMPLVVSDRGALGDRIGGRGRIFPAGDAHALRRILEELLEDPAALARLCEDPGPPPVTMADHWNELEAIYRHAVGTV